MTGWIDLSEADPRYRLDTAFYDHLRAARPAFTLAGRLVLEPYSGKGFVARKGQTFRVIEEEGCQIADIAMWNANDASEHFSSMRTWLVEGWIIRVNTRLWSELPWFRPMMTCIADTVVSETDDDYHHHFMGTHCAAETVEMGYGRAGLNACRLNLLQAIEPFGLGERNLRDNINVHEKNRLDPLSGKRSITRGDAKRGDYIEFYAEMDLIVGISVCPFGDGSADPTMYGTGVVRPLAVEIFDTGIEPLPFPEWRNVEGIGGGRVA